MPDFYLSYRADGVIVNVDIKRLKDERLGISANEIAFYRGELIHILRTAIEQANYFWSDGLTASIKARTSRYLEILKYECESESDFYAQYERLKNDMERFSDLFVNQYIESRVKKRKIKAKHLKGGLYFVCCVLGVSFDFLCRTINCPPPLPSRP